MGTLKKIGRALSNVPSDKVCCMLYLICWLASFFSLMTFKVQWEYLHREEASLEYPIVVYYAGAAILSALLASVIALIFAGALSGAYHFFFDLLRKNERRSIY